MTFLVVAIVGFGFHSVLLGSQESSQDVAEIEIHASDHPDDSVIEQGQQELGISMGMTGSTNLVPGGFFLSGSYLYRMVSNEWLETSLRFIRGSDESSCYRNRQSGVSCNYGPFAGSSAELSLSLRHYFNGPLRFRPFAKFGLGARVIDFRGDQVSGVGAVARIGGGLRARIAPTIVALGHFDIDSGLSYLNQGVGSSLWASLNVMMGLEFNIN